MSNQVIVIPAKRKKGNTIKETEEKKLRVCAYARVSTDSDEQATSYETQVEHYTEYIKNNEMWEFVEVFSDEGISGTYTKKRVGFNRMIDECMKGNIDLIITKSISRFARNTLDCLKYIRQLKEHNIAVFFEKENINTMDAKGEVLLTIMASLAQQESQSLSQNVKLGLQYRFQQGMIRVNHNRFLGYTKDENGNLIVDLEGSKTVKRIYREFLEGASLREIKEGLEEDNVINGAGNKRWHISNIKQILTNEKYMGDALLQKTYTVDFLNKKRVKNDGIMPQYYVENSHEAIIPKEIFMRVQAEMLKRANLHGENGKKRIYSSKYALSSLVYCSKCGEIYRRIAWNNRGKKSIVWRCLTRVEHGPSKCNVETLAEDALKDAVARSINQISVDKVEITKILEQQLESVLSNDREEDLSTVEEQIKKQQEILLELIHSKQNYDVVALEIERLQNEKQKLLFDNAKDADTVKRIQEIKNFIKNEELGNLEYNERLVRKLIKKIIINENTANVLFKSGIEVNVEI